MKNPFLIGYATICFLYILTLTTYLLRWRHTWRRLSAIALTVNVLVLLLITIPSGHFPFFNVFEGLLFVTLILGGLALLCGQTEKEALDVRSLVWIEILFLLGIVFFFPKEPSPCRPNHTYLWVVLFHGFRETALATMLYSAAHFLLYRLTPNRGSHRNLPGKTLRNHILQGRNFLLLSAVFFLCAEYFGMIWCQKGWGDFWRWSEPFFTSTLIILWLMVVFHIPGKSRRSDDIRAIVGATTCLLMLIVRIARGLS